MAERDDEAGDVPSLARAAQAAEQELERFEGLVAALRKIELGSEKSIVRAGKTLSEAVGAQERIAQVLSPLAQAFAHAQTREQVAANQLHACAEEIQKRSALFASLLEG